MRPREPNYDAENARLAEEAHLAHYGHGLSAERDDREACPRCGEKGQLLVADLRGAACEGCAERDAEGDVVTSEDGVL